MEEDIPVFTTTELSVFEYVEARAQEMLAMATAAKTVVGNNLPLQKLPRHMRRRAASHNVKRLPRQMHSWAEREYAKSGPPSKSKRPSRKHRRRPKNLLEEYNRRKRKNIWLESHIWHAKRFHMTEKWGYKIPLHPNDKGSRAAYRATAKYCMLQDLSYYCCLEITGLVRDVLKGLTRLSSPDTGLTFGAKSYLKGNREGQVVLYSCDKYPYDALGPVKYMWKYVIASETAQTISSSEVITDRLEHLWIWAHPAMYRDLMRELRKAYVAESVEDKSPREEKGIVKDIEVHTDGKRTDEIVEKSEQEVSLLKPETFSTNTVTVTSLKDLLCRFHLTGPLAMKILRETLVISDIGQKANLLDETKVNKDSMSVINEENQQLKTEPWWRKLCTNNALNNVYKKQKEFWDNIKTTVEVTPHCVIGLTVRDPRKLLPPKKSMVQFEDGDYCSAPGVCQLDDDVSWSALWDVDVRKEVKETKVPNSQINALRSALLVPGSQLPVSDDESRIPVLLVQNPGHQVSYSDRTDGGAPCWLGYGGGWDLILPGGWSMPFLVNLIYRGARVGGLKEYHKLMFEAGQFSYPNNFPDSAGGSDWESFDRKQLQEKYERTPPAKRVNYEKLGVVTPFHYLWQELISDWCALLSKDQRWSLLADRIKIDSGAFYVLRSRPVLKKLQRIIASDQKWRKSNGVTPPSRKISRTSQRTLSVHEEDALSSITSLLNDCQCLVAVRITMVQRGHPEPFAMICLPSDEDCTKFINDRSYSPVESVIKRGKPKNMKSKLKSNEHKNSGVSSDPTKLTSLVTSSSRPVMGFIKEGSFSYAGGCGFGLGFVAYAALIKCLELWEVKNVDSCHVLVRNTSSLQYRFATLSVANCFD